MARHIVRNIPTSLGFDGTSQDRYGVVNSPLSIGLTGDFTVGAWVNLFNKNATGDNDSNTLINVGFNYGNNKGYLFQIRNDGACVVYIGDTQYTMTMTTRFQYLQWNFVVFTLSGTTANVYINDMTTPAGTATVARKADNNLLNRLFSELLGVSNPRRLKGSINTFFAKQGLLTAAERTQIMNGTGSPAVDIMYRIDEGSGTTLTDVSGNGNNATLTNPKWVTNSQSVTRSSATNRLAIQDMKSSLSFNGTSTTVALTRTANLPLYSSTARTILAWVKLPNNLGAQVNVIYSEGSTSGAAPYTNVNVSNTTGRVGYFVRNDAAADIGSYETATRLQRHVWNRVAFVDNNGIVKVYINGVEDANSVAGLMNYTRTGTFTFNTSTWGAAIRNTTSFYLNGLLSNGRLYKSALTLDQINQAFAGGEPDAANRVGEYEFNEGAGSTAYDSSGNANHGTITAGTYTADVPTKKRELVGGNMVKNGDFEYAPPFTAATTASSKWIDGTAGGSTTNNLFNWATGTLTGTASVRYDNTVSYGGSSSLKLSTSAISSSAVVFNVQSLVAAQMKYAIPVLPNTSYTYSFMLKTNAISGSATTGAQVQFKGRKADATNVSVALAAGVTTTTDWTRYTGTFTTHVDARYMTIQIQVVGNDGAGTLIMDAYFDSIDLRPTTPTTRTAA